MTIKDMVIEEIMNEINICEDDIRKAIRHCFSNARLDERIQSGIEENLEYYLEDKIESIIDDAIEEAVSDAVDAIEDWDF